MLRNPALAALFMLALLSGFSMFAVLFYAPLLFQGGFGMSPQQAGLVITPLVVCITLGSIINGRIVTRIPKPNAMLYAGFALLTVAVAGMSVPVKTSLCAMGTPASGGASPRAIAASAAFACASAPSASTVMNALSALCAFSTRPRVSRVSSTLDIFLARRSSASSRRVIR